MIGARFLWVSYSDPVQRLAAFADRGDGWVVVESNLKARSVVKDPRPLALLMEDCAELDGMPVRLAKWATLGARPLPVDVEPLWTGARPWSIESLRSLQRESRPPSSCAPPGCRQRWWRPADIDACLDEYHLGKLAEACWQA